MKKLFLLLALSIPTMLFGQTFSLTNKGFVNTTDTSKDHLIIELPAHSKNDLYKKSLIYFSGLYVSPKDVLSTVENESITINGVEKNGIKMKVNWLNPSWDVNYTFNVQFKDGKIKFNQPVINKMTTTTGDIFRTATVFYQGTGKEIFNKKGELKIEEGKVALEEYINNFINLYLKSLNKKDDW